MASREYAYDVTKIEVLDDTTPNTPDDLDRAAKGLLPLAKVIKKLEKSYDSGNKILDESLKADDLPTLYRDPDETEDIWNDHSLGLDEQRQSVTRLRLLEVFHFKIPCAMLELGLARGNGLPGRERHAMAFEPYHHDMIMQGKYPGRKWAEEAACRLVQHIIAKYGIESFLTANMSGNNEKVAKLATVLQYYFNNGKEKTNNYIRHRQSSGTGTAVDGQEKADKRQQGRLGRTGVDTRTVGATFESDQRSGSSDR